jgi:cardiolipin synthase
VTDSTWFLVLAFTAIALQGLTFFLAFFEPTLRYRIAKKPPFPLDSSEFCRILGAIAESDINTNSKVEVLTNGDQFYEAELAAIAQAQRSINLEAYIFQRGDLTRRFLSALAERARAGVKVNLVMDAIGSFLTTRGYCKELIDAGGRVEFYNPIRWYTLPRLNNRTHRELIIIDGAIGFLGGAGFADHWMKDTRSGRRWRDTMFRVEGEAVTQMQSAFLENWLEASGELLTGPEYFSFAKVNAKSHVMVVESTPSAGGSTRARMLFQTLLASAERFIEITTPYFLPDRSVRDELIRTMKERGVDVRIIAPGKHNDHLLTRRSSRRLYGDLLKAGAKIYEYKKSMIHTKSLVVDGLWCAVGSTNFDHRSFGINDEVNLAAKDEALAARLREDFAHDLALSDEITYDKWRSRPFWEKLHEGLGWMLERQE